MGWKLPGWKRAKWGAKALAVFLVMFGLLGLLDVTSPMLRSVNEVIAVAAGVLLLLDW